MKDTNKTSLIKSAIVFILITVLAIVAWKLLVSKQQINEAIEYIQSFGAWSVFVFGIIYVVLVSASFPSSVFNLAAGIIFGFTVALPLALTCGLLASLATFTFSRHFLHDFVCDKLKKTKNGSKHLSMIEKHSAKLVFMLRLNPFIPAVVKNYGLGVTNMKTFTYAWATLLGQIPLTTFYVYLGWIGGHSMLSQDNKPDALHWVMLGLGLVVSIATLFLSKYYIAKWSADDGTLSQG